MEDSLACATNFFKVRGNFLIKCKYPTLDTCQISLSVYIESGQQIRSKIDSFQNANFLISQPNPMMLPLIGIVTTHWNRLGETISMRVTS